MTAPEDAIAALRRARPELPTGMASPASEAAQALLEEILSMRIPEIDLVPTDPAAGTDTRPASRRPRRSRRPLVLVAAAAVAVAGVAAVAVTTTGDSSGGESVEVGPATGDSVVPGETTNPGDAVVPAVPADTGRVRVSNDSRWKRVPRMPSVETYVWSGDDFGVQQWGLVESGVADGRPWTCEIDLGHLLDSGAEPPVDVPVSCEEAPPQRPRALDIDPATLLDQLAVAGPFTPVGDEEVEGVPTQRRRATNPAATPIDALFLMPIFPDDATVTALEVWVDGDDRVRRLDVTTGGVADGGNFTEMNSFVWFDLGEPLTIEPPAPGEVVRIDSIEDLIEQDLEAEAPDPGDEPDMASLPDPETEVGG